MNRNLWKLWCEAGRHWKKLIPAVLLLGNSHGPALLQTTQRRRRAWRHILNKTPWKFLNLKSTIWKLSGMLTRVITFEKRHGSFTFSNSLSVTIICQVVIINVKAWIHEYANKHTCTHRHTQQLNLVHKNVIAVYLMSNMSTTSVNTFWIFTLIIRWKQITGCKYTDQKHQI